MKDVAPILVQNCIACHNPKKVGEQVYHDHVLAPVGQRRPAGGWITPEAGRSWTRACLSS